MHTLSHCYINENCLFDIHPVIFHFCHQQLKSSNKSVIRWGIYYCTIAQLFIYFQSKILCSYSFISFVLFSGSQEKDTISIGSQKEEVIKIIAYQLRDIWACVLARQLADLGYVRWHHRPAELTTLTCKIPIN